MIFKVSQEPQVLEETLKEIALLLKGNKVGAIPTETFYGLACNPFSEAALERLFYLKRRPPDKPLLLLLGSLDDLSKVVARVPAKAQKLIKTFWPGPLTIVLPAKASLSPLLTAGTGTIGVRLSSCELTRRIARAFGAPITGTSANVSDRPPCKTAEEVLRELGEVDFIVDGGETPGGLPSTVVSLLENEVELIREGVIPFEEVLKALKEKSP